MVASVRSIVEYHIHETLLASRQKRFACYLSRFIKYTIFGSKLDISDSIVEKHIRLAILCAKEVAVVLTVIESLDRYDIIVLIL